MDEYRAGRRESLGNPLEFARWVGGCWFDEHVHFDGAGSFGDVDGLYTMVMRCLRVKMMLGVKNYINQQ